MTQSTNEIRDVLTERAVLGCVLAGSRPAETGLPVEAFTGAGRHVWDAMLSLEREGAAIDHITIAERLKARNRLAECGGPAGLMELDTGAHWTHNLPSYVAILRDRMTRRASLAAIDLARTQLLDLGAAPLKATLALSQALTATGGVGTEESPDVDLYELASQWDAWTARDATGSMGLDDGVLLKTGIEKLDEKGEGMPSNLCVLLGLASMGKTALAAEIIMNWLRGGVGGGIFGLENGTSWLTRRHLSRHLGLPVGKMGRTRLHEHQQARLSEWMNWAASLYLANLRIHRAGGLHASDLISTINRWISEGVGPEQKRKKLRWVWIDHGLRIDYGMADQRRYDLAIGKTLDALANLGEKHGVCMCVNWHLNRSSDQNTKPTIAMAKESGYLEAAARWMLAVWEQPQRPGMVLGTALKVTEGPRDWTVALERDAEHALVSSTGGYVVDFEAEAEEAKRLAALAKKDRDASAPKYFDRRTS